ncbi:hypothetical protein FO519_000909 [Halicephalobus sp. NKZ332]|nr:hypothetical protein FO519_000909 [Halicephalobus sp. NKZ332]
MLPKDPNANRLFDKTMVKALVFISIGVLAVFLVTFAGKYHKTHVGVPPKPKTLEQARLSIGDKLIANVRGENIRDNLRLITPEPHVAGTSANKRVGEKILQLWKKNGLEDVHFVEYEVLLSYPDYDNPNHVSIIGGDGKIIYRSNGTSPVIIPAEQGGLHAGIQWVAYSAPGTVEGEVVYCHYGMEKDFERLGKMGLSVRGRIALIRYGFGFRGDKVSLAQKNGAIGVILFSDPAEVAKDGTDKEHIYPRTEWMPEGGVQRGSVMHGDGDPLTPLSPSKADLYPTRTVEEAKASHILPSIPVLPISYRDAYEVLLRMDGRAVPLDWQGGLNFTYRLGPGFKDTSMRTKIEVHSTLQKRQIRNVVGYIRGSSDPDHYVILGNHYDAWVYGSLDPNSGTATLAEVGRALVQTMNESNWRPARTIMFCNWDAEEYGLLGSTEFVEEFEKQLSERAIIYLNVDTISSNLSFAAASVPTLFQSVVDTSRRIPNPMESEIKRSRKTVYDTWVKSFPGSIYNHPDFPQMPVPGGGSDQASFLNFLGIPVVDFRYKNTTWDEYPLYHSLYETPFTNEHLFDTNDFAVHRAVGQFWAEIARSFADSPIVPLNATIFADQILNDYVHALKLKLDPMKNRFPEAQDARVQLTRLIRNSQDFLRRAKEFDGKIEDTKQHLPYFNGNNQAASITRKLMMIDRCFISPFAFPQSPQKRHLLFSVSDKDSYSSSVMAGIYDQIENLETAGTAKEKALAGRRLAEEISLVQEAIQCATNSISDFI